MDGGQPPEAPGAAAGEARAALDQECLDGVAHEGPGAAPDDAARACVPLAYSHVAAFVCAGGGATAAAAAATSGNPAGVVLCPAPPAAAFCARVAAQFGLPETAFVSPRGGAGGGGFRAAADFDLRWFTPTTEVPLCGHATLASAHALFDAGNACAELRFHTLSGVLAVSRAGGGGGGALTMRFPHNAPAAVMDAATLAALRPLLAHTLRAAGGAGGGTAPAALDVDALLHSVHYSGATRKLVVRLADAHWAVLRELQPDPAAMLAADQAPLAALRGGDCAAAQRGAPPYVTGVSVTVRAPPPPPPAASSSAAAAAAPAVDDDAPVGAPAAADDGWPCRYDFWSRYFTPWNGIPEDPVNGSSHTVLGPYWAAALAAAGAAGEGCVGEPAPAGRLTRHADQTGLPAGGGRHVRVAARLRAWQASPATGDLRVEVTEVRPLLLLNECGGGRQHVVDNRSGSGGGGGGGGDDCAACAAAAGAGAGAAVDARAVGPPLAPLSSVALTGTCLNLRAGTLLATPGDLAGDTQHATLCGALPATGVALPEPRSP